MFLMIDLHCVIEEPAFRLLRLTSGQFAVRPLRSAEDFVLHLRRET